MRRRSRAPLARRAEMRLALAAVALVLACAAQAAEHRVVIEGMKFVPERLEVKHGDRITWVNKDFVPHTVTAAEAHVESGDIAAGKSWRFIAKKKGEMPYICRLHPVMK